MCVEHIDTQINWIFIEQIAVPPTVFVTFIL